MKEYWVCVCMREKLREDSKRWPWGTKRGPNLLMLPTWLQCTGSKNGLVWSKWEHDDWYTWTNIEDSLQVESNRKKMQHINTKVIMGNTRRSFQMSILTYTNISAQEWDQTLSMNLTDSPKLTTIQAHGQRSLNSTSCTGWKIVGLKVSLFTRQLRANPHRSLNNTYTHNV